MEDRSLLAANNSHVPLPLSSSLDLLDDSDFESTMLLLEHSGRRISFSTPAYKRLSLRRGSLEGLDLSLASLAELFPPDGTGLEAKSFLSDDLSAPLLSTVSGGQTIQSRSSSMTIQAPIGVDGPSPLIKLEPRPPELSPVMDSFLRESWEGISELTGKTRRTSSRLQESLGLGLKGHSVSLQSLDSKRRPTSKVLSHFPSTLLKPSPTSSAMSRHSHRLRSPSKQPRRTKQCEIDGCTRRAQSNNRCKTHGGGARCQTPGCDKSSQGGGLCRAHGGGKKCRVAGCTKGTQRLGLCYLHGGIRRCLHEGCKKKDRGNGYCITHGGGRRCEAEGCERSVRKGNHCQTHQTSGS